NKLSELSNITTTVKTIVSTVLATQNTAGFVTYINALNPVLVVGPNEIVKFTTSDTGRTFELNLRGRSFGIGQPAITTANVIETTEFLNKDLKLSNYPSTRNDGQSSTNKFLGTDANGNLKMYTLPNFQAPFLGEAFPSFLPNSTGDLTIMGAFFTPLMTVTITGQTVNYVTFINDNLIKVNITTGSLEGNFTITLNNGISVVFPNALSIILGTIYEPNTGDWENISGSINLNEKGSVKITAMNSGGAARWNKLIDHTKNFSVRFNVKKSPLGYPNFNTQNGLSFRKISDNSEELWCDIKNYNSVSVTNYRGSSIDTEDQNHMVPNNGPLWLNWWLNVAPTYVFEIRSINGFIYLYQNTVLYKTFTKKFTEHLKIVVDVQAFDIENIKYIELVS
ncbi:hypothetical protein, partial [Flavobacterium sp. LC2016-01]|uniref:hypothetical protein n=1 Tax=Flavobacterium sp. LC2016-01 TaxID=2675876 RepID=UPI0018AC910A